MIKQTILLNYGATISVSWKTFFPKIGFGECGAIYNLYWWYFRGKYTSYYTHFRIRSVFFEW